MICGICSRQAKGYGWFNPRTHCLDPARYNRKWIFCSRRCQQVFCTLASNLENPMIDTTEMELSAMHLCLEPLGNYVSVIGMHRSLAEYTRDEILGLIDVVVTNYQENMVAEHIRMSDRDCVSLDPSIESLSKTMF